MSPALFFYQRIHRRHPMPRWQKRHDALIHDPLPFNSYATSPQIHNRGGAEALLNETPDNVIDVGQHDYPAEEVTVTECQVHYRMRGPDGVRPSQGSNSNEAVGRMGEPVEVYDRCQQYRWRRWSRCRKIEARLGQQQRRHSYVFVSVGRIAD
ncbi:MAG: hypothetical protein Q9157_001732 [Trypethelium eluteriae]